MVTRLAGVLCVADRELVVKGEGGGFGEIFPAARSKRIEMNKRWVSDL